MAALVSGSRILYAMARAGRLPAPLGRVSKSGLTPWVATVVVTIGSLVLLPLGTVAVVAGLSSFASLLAFAFVNTAVVLLRVREPMLARPFRVPGSVRRVPVLSLIGIGLAFVLVTQLDMRVLAAGTLVVAMLLGAYALGHRRAFGGRAPREA
jgi:APA family basic amino acid/polyamine antiporter